MWPEQIEGRVSSHWAEFSFCGEYQEFCFGHIKYEMSVRCEVADDFEYRFRERAGDI